MLEDDGLNEKLHRDAEVDGEGKHDDGKRGRGKQDKVDDPSGDIRAKVPDRSAIAADHGGALPTTDMFHRLHDGGDDKKEHGCLLQTADDARGGKRRSTGIVCPTEHLVERVITGGHLDEQIEDEPNRYRDDSNTQKRRQLVAIDIQRFQQVVPDAVDAIGEQRKRCHTNDRREPKLANHIRDEPRAVLRNRAKGTSGIEPE